MLTLGFTHIFNYLLCFPSQSASSCFLQLLPVRAQRQPTGDEQHPEPWHHASVCHRSRGGRWEERTHASSLVSLQLWNTGTDSLYIFIVDGMVSNLRRIRLRSNSTGTRPSFRRGASRRIAHQLETPEKPKSPANKVPKSASVSGLSLIITPGRHLFTIVVYIDSVACSNSGHNNVFIFLFCFF